MKRGIAGLAPSSTGLLGTRKGLCVLVAVLLVCGAEATRAYGQTYGFRVSYEDDGDRVLRPFRIWVPPDVPQLRGAVFLWAGAGQDWRDRVGWPSFQRAARALSFALVGTHDNELGQTRAEVDIALDRIMTAAAEVSGHPELAAAPVALIGFSQGGYRSSRAAALASGRVIGLVGHKGAQAIPLSEAGQQVPALFIAGEHDGSFPPDFIRQVFQEWRNEGGRAAYAVDWNVGHNDQGNQGWEAAWYWLAEVIRLRYPDDAPSEGFPLLQDVPLEAGWLADKARFRSDGTPFITHPFFRIAPYAEYASSKEAASWLPSAGAAYMYRAFTSTDTAPRDEVPYQTPLYIRTPNALAAIPVDSTIRAEVDPRSFGQDHVIDRIELYIDSTALGLAVPDPDSAMWTLPYTPRAEGVHALVAVAVDTAGVRRTTFRTVVVTPAATSTATIPTDISSRSFRSWPPYPNPSAGTATLLLDLARPSSVRVEVFDVLGRVVATLVRGPLPTGRHAVPFEAANLAGGLYLVHIVVGSTLQTHPLLLTR